MKTARRLKTIPLKPSKMARQSQEGAFTLVAWTKAAPFAVNRRGVMTHRVRHVSTILYRGAESHHHVDYLCGNGCNVDLEFIDDTLTADPPKDRLLCANCESRAEQKRLPSGDELAGRHVHRGVLVPTQTCCR